MREEEASLRCQLSWQQRGGQMIMADSGSSEEAAVIGNTDITSTESENNIINTVVLFVISCTRHVSNPKEPLSVVKKILQIRPKLATSSLKFSNGEFINI